MDRQLYDQVYYQVGSDLSFLDEGLNVTSGSLIATPNTLLSILQPQENTSNQEITKRKTGFLPISEYTRFPGVIAGTRVGQYAAGFSIAGTNETAIFLGIDRVDFPKVAFWRNDFSEQSLGELMNALALTPDGVLIPQSAMNQEALNLGDVLQVSVADDSGINVRIPLKIVGSFRLFPGWYPDQGILLVGNLDQLFEAAGGQYPYRVWFKTSPGADLSLIGEQTVRAIKIRLLNWQGAMSQIRSVQQSPDRQGLLGLLSVGFLAAAILTVIGFFLFALFSFQRRFIEMGILRAIGLSATQMASFLACELAFLILMGVAVGTGLGVGASRLFIPFFQVGSGARALIPPYMVKISWVEISRVYALFGLMFIFAFASLVVLLRRIKIFQAIKLGESY
jgi:putative ABC transport system permease protein